MKNAFFKSVLCILGCIGLLAGTATADTFGPTDIDGGNGVLELLNSDFFNEGNVTESDFITRFDFTGMWDYTAIAFEANNVDLVREGVSGDWTTEFKTKLTHVLGSKKYGTWETVDFDNENLRFVDTSTDPNTSKNLDILNKSKQSIFHFYMLTEDSQALTWMNDPTFFLKAGTYILGYSDSGVDGDYDDIIMAMAPVPEPATMLLFGAGIAGFAGLRLRRKKK